MNQDEERRRIQARQKAQNQFTSSEQRDVALKSEIEVEHARIAAKTARLRGLRLANEAVEAARETEQPKRVSRPRKRIRRIQSG